MTVKGPGDEVDEGTVLIDMQTMKFSSTRGEEVGINIEPEESSDPATLLYYIPKKDVQFIRNNKDAYVQANMQVTEDEDGTGNGKGYVSTHLYLYNVSE